MPLFNAVLLSATLNLVKMTHRRLCSSQLRGGDGSGRNITTRYISQSSREEKVTNKKKRNNKSDLVTRSNLSKNVTVRAGQRGRADARVSPTHVVSRRLLSDRFMRH